MNREEFNSLFKDAVNPDTAPLALDAIRNGVDELFTLHESAVAQNETDAKTIASLRDVNARLYLKLSGEVEENEPAERTRDDIIRELKEAHNS